MCGEFLVAPEVGSLAGLGTLGVIVVGHVAAAHSETAHAAHSAYASAKVARCVKTVGGVEHVVVIDRNGNHRHRDAFVDEIRLRRCVGRLVVYEFGTANDGVCCNLLCNGDLLGSGCGE